MAQAPQGGDGAANFVRHIVSDPKNVPDVTLLSGYLGASSEEGHERLYLSPDLTNYVEIPKVAILHQAPLPKEQDAHGGVTLWVKKDAALRYKMAPAAQALASYFAGAIQAGAQGAAPAAGGAAAFPHPTRFCPTHHVTCAAACEPTLHCPTEITPCLNTHAVTCACPLTAACPTQVGPFCQTQGDCTFIGCGHTLACTQGLLCAGVAAAGVAPQAAQAVRHTIPACLPHTPFCPTRIGCPPHTPFCPTRFECRTRFDFTCGPCPTRFEVSCAPCVTQHPVQCPTRFGFTCNPVCHFTNPAVCQVVTNPACHVTNPLVCPIASGPVCPPVSFDCPQSPACGGFPGQPGFGGPGMQARDFSFHCQCTEAFCGVPTNASLCIETPGTPCVIR